MSRQPVYINWGISSFFGWGVYGLNLALHWSSDPDLALICTQPVDESQFAQDPLRLQALVGMVERSRQLEARLEGHGGKRATVPGPMLASCDHQFGVNPAVHGVVLTGTPNLSVTFFETAQLEPDAVARAATRPAVITGSTWNTQVLGAHGLTNVRKVIQGVDPGLFHPAPRLGLLADRFCVFSGGKLERRKGQDIVLAAFRRFAARHPDALLVTAWHSPWPEAARTVDASALVGPVVFNAEGHVDVTEWALANGIAAENILDLGGVPNAQMPALLNEMDVALFPNRAEGGTNLVAMECMACGVPVILSANTGHLDLVEDNNCYPLVRQGVLVGWEAPFADVAGWGESDLDEVVDALERVYADRAEARARGLRGAAFIGQYSWARTAAEMKDIVLA